MINKMPIDNINSIGILKYNLRYNVTYNFNPLGRFSSLADSPGRPIITWSAMKLPVELRSLAGLRIRGTSHCAIESSRLCCHLASISLESSTISLLSFTRSMVHFSSL